MKLYKSYRTNDFQINLTTNCQPVAELIDRYLDFSHARTARKPVIKLDLHIRENRDTDPNEYDNFLHSGYAKKGPHLFSSLAMKFADVRINPRKNLITAQILRFHEGFKERILDYILLRSVRALFLTKGLFFLHASAVKKGGRTVIICGHSNCGKSTLALTLSNGGFRLLADDDCFLRQDKGRLFLHPFPTKMGLRHGPPALSGIKTTGYLHGQKMRFSLSRLYDKNRDGDLKNAIIIFPLYSTGKNLKITALKNRDALRRLVKESLITFKIKGADRRTAINNFWALYALARQARCFEIKYNDRLLGHIPSAIDRISTGG